MTECPLGAPVRLIPLGRPRVELRYEFGLVPGQFAPQQLAEQSMEAVPLAAIVEGYQQQVSSLEALEAGGRIGGAEHRVAQPATEILEDRHPPQEHRIVRRQPVEYLGPQVVADEPVVAAHFELTVGNRDADGHRDAGQIQTRRPTLGAIDDSSDVDGREIGARPDEQAPGLGDVHREFACADLQQIALHPQTGRRKPWLHTRGKDQLNSGGELDRDLFDDLQALRVGQTLELIDDQCERIDECLHRREQSRCQRCRATVCGDIGEHSTTERRDPVQRTGDVGAQDDRVVVGIVDRQPGDRGRRVLGHLGQHRRLAVSRRRDDGHDGRARLPDPFEQRGPPHDPAARGDRAQFRRSNVECRRVHLGGCRTHVRRHLRSGPVRGDGVVVSQAHGASTPSIRGGSDGVHSGGKPTTWCRYRCSTDRKGTGQTYDARRGDDRARVRIGRSGG